MELKIIKPCKIQGPFVKKRLIEKHNVENKALYVCFKNPLLRATARHHLVFEVLKTHCITCKLHTLMFNLYIQHL